MDSEHPMYDLLTRLDPSETALLDWLVPHLDESHLREIAAVDGWNEEAYFQALKPIYARQPLPVPLTWMPREVLELARWSEPDAPVWDGHRYVSATPHSRGTRGHLMRAFCCGVLLQAADTPETRGLLSSENDTLIVFVESVLHLGKEASESALRFLAWRVLRIPKEFNETPFFVMALLLLCAALFEPDQDDTDLILLCEWVVAEEAHVRSYLPDYWAEEEWLLGLTHYGNCNEYWRRLAQALLLDPAKSFPEPTASTLREVAKRLRR
jgi:hypothetical protein